MTDTALAPDAPALAPPVRLCRGCCTGTCRPRHFLCAACWSTLPEALRTLWATSRGTLSRRAAARAILGHLRTFEGVCADGRCLIYGARGPLPVRWDVATHSRRLGWGADSAWSRQAAAILLAQVLGTATPAARERVQALHHPLCQQVIVHLPPAWRLPAQGLLAWAAAPGEAAQQAVAARLLAVALPPEGEGP